MAFIRLRDVASGEEQDFHGSTIRVGRDPEFEIVPTGPIAEVVSGRHLMMLHDEGRWWIEDLGSSNGTYLNDERLSPGKRYPLVRGAVIRLGRAGPQFSIVNTAERRASPTLIEQPLALGEDHVVRPDAVAVTTPMIPLPVSEDAPDPMQPPLLVVLRNAATEERYEAQGDRVRIGRSRENDVQLASDHDTSVSRNHAEIVPYTGAAVIRDLRSRNGTFVNGERITGDRRLLIGDRVQLGPEGPELLVENLVTEADESRSRDFHGPAIVATVSPASLGSDWARRRGAGTKDRSSQDVAYGQDRRPNIVRRAVWLALAAVALLAGGFYWMTAFAGRAPTAGPESAVAQAETNAAAPQGESPNEDGPQPVDFAEMARANRGAMGLVLAYANDDVILGSGFVVTRSGYFLTNRHLALSRGESADSVFVRLAGYTQRFSARVIATTEIANVDLAVLQIPGYAGPSVANVNWDGAGVTQGETVAVLAIADTTNLRTTLDTGVVAAASIDAIRLDGLTRSGFSGSPVFNAQGFVVALRGGSVTSGEALAIPISSAASLLPLAARQELGITARVQ